MRAALLAAVLLLLAGCGGFDPPAVAGTPTSAAPSALPDGRVPTPEQQAFLDEVLPQLSEDHAADVLRVLEDGESVCTVFLHPTDPTAQQQAVGMFTQQDFGWTETEAWVVVRAAPKHFCPDK